VIRGNYGNSPDKRGDACENRGLVTMNVDQPGTMERQHAVQIKPSARRHSSGTINEGSRNSQSLSSSTYFCIWTVQTKQSDSTGLPLELGKQVEQHTFDAIKSSAADHMEHIAGCFTLEALHSSTPSDLLLRSHEKTLAKRGQTIRQYLYIT